MIDWRIVLGAFGGGLALTCWLESLHRLRQAQKKMARLLQGTAVLMTLLAASLWAYAYFNPLWLQAVASGPVAQTAVAPTVRLTPSPLAPPSVFIMATPAPPTGSPPAPLKDAATEGSYLHIPALGVSQSIVELPLENGRWQVSSLGEQVGRLDGTGTLPGDTLAPVFAGHMTFPASAALETGAFANLQYATYGTEVIYEVNGTETRYTVTEISRVAPSDVERLFLEDGESILLTTCTDWDVDGRLYTNRLLVRAVRKQ